MAQGKMKVKNANIQKKAKHSKKVLGPKKGGTNYFFIPSILLLLKHPVTVKDLYFFSQKFSRCNRNLQSLVCT